MVPFAKTGGLADVAGTLPEYLVKNGCSVRVFLPYYSTIQVDVRKVSLVVDSVDISVGDTVHRAEIWEVQTSSPVRVYLVRCDFFFRRVSLYGTPDGDYPDNAQRFILFSKAVFEFCYRSGFVPDIMHCHDWQTGLIPAYLKTICRVRDNPLRECRSVFTIHNMAYQGVFPREDFSLTGLPDSVFGITGLEFWGKMNMLKSGILYADRVTTVSEQYSREIQTPEYGCGLEGVLRDRRNDLHGILNGVDYDVWNPARDPHISAVYDPSDLAGKKKCKTALLKEFGLPGLLAEKPLIGIVSRLAAQKGFDLIEKCFEELMQQDIGLVVLGAGDAPYQDMLERFARAYPDRAGVVIGYDNVLAHKIEAGSDMFLMPSQYEPCGLNQIFSLKYGTVPIVRATGGLDDSIVDYDPKTGQGTGFKFAEYKAAALLRTVKRALKFYHKPDHWERIMLNGMACDFSWTESAGKYVRLYKETLKKSVGLSANQ